LKQKSWIMNLAGAICFLANLLKTVQVVPSLLASGLFLLYGAQA